MTVAHDAFGGSGSTTTVGNVDHTHTPSGTPRGALVLIVQGGSADEVSEVNYGGVSMYRLPDLGIRTVTETLRVYAYFLGWDIPTGAQTVRVVTTAGTAKSIRSVTVTAAGDTAPDTVVGGSGLAANPSLTIDPQAASEIYYANGSGLNAPVSTPQAGTTQLGTQDNGATSAHYGRKTSAAGASTTIGWTSASDDFAHVAVAIREAVGPQLMVYGSDLVGTGSPKSLVVPDCKDGDKLGVIAIGNASATNTVTAVGISTTAGSTGSWNASPNSPQLSSTSACWCAAYEADVTADGDVTVEMTRTQAATQRPWGFHVYRIKGDTTSGVEFVEKHTSDATEVISAAIAADSAVLVGTGDWDALAPGTLTPTDGFEFYRALVSTAYTHVAAYWLAQPSGTRDYGTTGSSGTRFRGELVEILPASGVVTVELAGALPALTGSFDIESSADVDLAGTLPALVGDFAISTPVLEVELAGTLPALQGSFDVDASAETTLAGTLPALTGDFAVAAAADVQLAGTLPILTGALAVESTADVELAGTLPALTGDFSIAVGGLVQVSLAGTLPSLTGSFDLDAEATVGLAGVLPPLVGSFDLEAAADVTLAGTLPLLTGAFTVEALGAPIPDPNPLRITFTEPVSRTFAMPARHLVYDEATTAAHTEFAHQEGT